MSMAIENDRSVEEECKAVLNNLPYFQKLFKSDKISTKEKLSVLEDVNIDIAAFLMSIGEEI